MVDVKKCLGIGVEDGQERLVQGACHGEDRAGLPQGHQDSHGSQHHPQEGSKYNSNQLPFRLLLTATSERAIDILSSPLAYAKRNAWYNALLDVCAVSCEHIFEAGGCLCYPGPSPRAPNSCCGCARLLGGVRRVVPRQRRPRLLFHDEFRFVVSSSCSVDQGRGIPQLRRLRPRLAAHVGKLPRVQRIGKCHQTRATASRLSCPEK